MLRKISHDSLHCISIAEPESWVLSELSWNKRFVVVWWICYYYEVSGRFYQCWQNGNQHQGTFANNVPDS